METMKPDKQQPKAGSDGERGFAVYELRFCIPGGRDIGIQGQSAGGSGILRRNEQIDITYFPQRRFYRLVETSRDPKVKTKTVYIPETWATWEPAE